jgi:hypothetical protein
VLYFFSGQQNRQEPGQRAVEQFEETEPGVESSGDERVTSNESETRQNEDTTTAEHQEEQQRREEPAAESRAETQRQNPKKAVDREKLFLSMEKISKFGRVTLNVRKYPD